MTDTAIKMLDLMASMGEQRLAGERRMREAILALAECIESDSAEPARAFLSQIQVFGMPGDRLDHRYLTLLRSMVESG
jgi:hypothetical protein